jgi:hypothetical protein
MDASAQPSRNNVSPSVHSTGKAGPVCARCRIHPFFRLLRSGKQPMRRCLRHIVPTCPRRRADHVTPSFHFSHCVGTVTVSGSAAVAHARESCRDLDAMPQSYC